MSVSDAFVLFGGFSINAHSVYATRCVHVGYICAFMLYDRASVERGFAGADDVNVNVPRAECISLRDGLASNLELRRRAGLG